LRSFIYRSVFAKKGDFLGVHSSIYCWADAAKERPSRTTLILSLNPELNRFYNQINRQQRSRDSGRCWLGAKIFKIKTVLPSGLDSIPDSDLRFANVSQSSNPSSLLQPQTYMNRSTFLLFTAVFLSVNDAESSRPKHDCRCTKKRRSICR
jgi:hypothetical protein